MPNYHDRKREAQRKAAREQQQQNPAKAKADEKAERESLSRARRARKGKREVVDKKGRPVNCTACKGAGFVFNRREGRWLYCELCGAMGVALEDDR